MNIYDFEVKSREGRDVSLRDFQGKVLLVVNTATACRFTEQYDELEALYAKYKDKGFEILDFPCNQFGQQAQGSDDEIHQFCVLRYHTGFTRFSKVEVNGPNESKVFLWLKSQLPFKGFNISDPAGKEMDEQLSKYNPGFRSNNDIKWNFTKFLIDRRGDAVARYESPVKSSEYENAIRRLL